MHPTTSRVLICLGLVAGPLLVPAAAQTDPSVPGYAVSIHAAGLSNATSLSFDPSGTLWVGHEDNGRPTRVFRVTAGGGAFALYGDTDLTDPDVAVYDPYGVVSGTVGSVLVGGGCGTPANQGCVWSVEPGGRTGFAIGPTPAFQNVIAMAWTPAGELLWTDGAGRQVLKSTRPGEAVVLFTLPATSVGLAVAPDGRIFTSAADGVVRVHDSRGTLLDGAFATGLAAWSVLRFAPTGPFGGQLYALETVRDGSLFRIDGSGNKTVVGTGFFAGGLDWGPDGALYVTHRPIQTASTVHVLRIASCNDAVLLADINRLNLGNGANYGSNPWWVVTDEATGTVYFSATDGVHGTELWKIDGKTGRVALVADIAPGYASSQPFALIVLDRTVYFAADDGVHGQELWKSDGTAAGTVLVADIHPGNPSAGIRSLTGVPRNAPATGHDLYFTADDGKHGQELWKSDGTSAGTEMVADIRAGSEGSWPYDLCAHRVGGPTGMWRLYFFANSGQRNQLWTSDGTAALTAMVHDARIGSGSPQQLTSWNGILLFNSGGGTGPVLWQSDGTSAGTAPRSQTARDPFGFVPGQGTLAGWLFFQASTGTDPDNHELWRTDGKRVEMVAEILPGPQSSRISNLTAFGDRMLFRADDGVHGKELWVTDGTGQGTHMVKDVRPGPDASVGPTTAHYTVVANGQAWFSADDGTHGQELWVTDGTPAGTKLSVDIHPGSFGSAPGQLMVWKQRILFTADDGLHGQEPWSISTQVAIRASHATIGPGCAGSQGVPSLGALPGQRPAPGGTFETVLSGVPANAPLFGLLGFTSVPIDLSLIGMTGCLLQTTADLVEPLTNRAGSARWALSIPADPGVLGALFYQQALVFDPPANRFGATLSNACAGVVGCR